MINGEIITNTDYSFPAEYEKDIAPLQNELAFLNQLPVEIKSDMIKLREVISLYLKIEWDIAKNGN